MPEEKIEYDYVTLEDIQGFLLSSNRSKSDFLYKIEKRGGKYVLPHSALSIIASLVDGTLQRKWAGIPVEEADTGDVSGAGGTSLEVAVDTDSGGIIELLGIMASWVMNATVADRTCRINIPLWGLPNCWAVVPNSLIPALNVTLSASQYGSVSWFPGDDAGFTMDNGTQARTEDIFPRKLHLASPATLHANIAANGQTTDKSRCAIFYREVGLE